MQRACRLVGLGLVGAVVLMMAAPCSYAEDELITPPKQEIDNQGYPSINSTFNFEIACAFVNFYRNKTTDFVREQRNIKLVNHINVYDEEVYYYEYNDEYNDIRFEATHDKIDVPYFDISGELATGYLTSRDEFTSSMGFSTRNLTRYDFNCEYDYVSVFFYSNSSLRIQVRNYYGG